MAVATNTGAVLLSFDPHQRTPVVALPPQVHGRCMCAAAGSFWTDPVLCLWLLQPEATASRQPTTAASLVPSRLGLHCAAHLAASSLLAGGHSGGAAAHQRAQGAGGGSSGRGPSRRQGRSGAPGCLLKTGFMGGWVGDECGPVILWLATIPSVVNPLDFSKSLSS
jgi:hypothetical protein